MSRRVSIALKRIAVIAVALICVTVWASFLLRSSDQAEAQRDVTHQQLATISEGIEAWIDLNGGVIPLTLEDRLPDGRSVYDLIVERGGPLRSPHNGKALVLQTEGPGCDMWSFEQEHYDDGVLYMPSVKVDRADGVSYWPSDQPTTYALKGYVGKIMQFWSNCPTHIRWVREESNLDHGQDA